MAEASVNPEGQTVTVTEEETSQDTQRLVLKLKKPDEKRKVKWEEGTVDNEHMDKKKSKCCCIYQKPRMFGESSSEDDSDDDECSAHCRGHKKHSHNDHQEDGASGSGGAEGSMAAS